jgi:hypothetical protein
VLVSLADTREKQEFVNAINQTSESQNITAHLLSLPAKLTEDAMETFFAARRNLPPLRASTTHKRQFHSTHNNTPHTTHTMPHGHLIDRISLFTVGQQVNTTHHKLRPLSTSTTNTSNTPPKNSATTVVSMDTSKRNVEKCNEIH